jgi:hypothetical protein
LSVCTPLFNNTVTSSLSHIGLGIQVCVYTIFLLFRCPVLCTLNDVDVNQLYHSSLRIHSSPKWGILRYYYYYYYYYYCVCVYLTHNAQIDAQSYHGQEG